MNSYHIPQSIVRSILALLTGLLIVAGVVPAQAQPTMATDRTLNAQLNAQGLVSTPWYAVVYQPATNTLHWVNAAGEQVVLPRPTLPDEAQYRDLRISPNG